MEPDEAKVTIHVSVDGPPTSGKSTAIRLIKEALGTRFEYNSDVDTYGHNIQTWHADLYLVEDPNDR